MNKPISFTQKNMRTNSLEYELCSNWVIVLIGLAPALDRLSISKVCGDRVLCNLWGLSRAVWSGSF